MSQKNKPLDDLDRKLVAWLAEDGRSSAGDLAQALGVAPPTIRSRIRRLLADGILRVAGLIDPSRVEDVTLALVALTLTKQEELEAKLEQIGRLEQVQWAAVSSGRYDLLVEVCLTGGIPDLYDFLTHTLPALGGIQSSESFLLMKTKRKWILPPPGSRS